MNVDQWFVTAVLGLMYESRFQHVTPSPLSPQAIKSENKIAQNQNQLLKNVNIIIRNAMVKLK